MPRKIKNPLGDRKPIGNGYEYQVVSLGPGRGYVKLWHRGKVIDSALTVSGARAMAKRYATRQLFGEDLE